MGGACCAPETLAADDAGQQPDIVGWAGLLVPYDQPSVDGRVVRRPPGGARVRQPPLELKWQELATGFHDGAVVGLASITKVWEDERGLWGSGEFDRADPRAMELARKIRDGFAGHVSVDLGDIRAQRQTASNGEVLEAITDWKLLSTTIVADAAMDGARIYAVTDPSKITPTAEVLANRRETDGVFSATGPRARLAFSAAPDAPDAGVTLTITRATGLPWAPRDTNWDAAAAKRRLAALCGGTGDIDPGCYGRAFIFREAGADPSLVGSYTFPFADVINGRLQAVYRGVAAAAQRVDSAGITSADKDAVRAALRGLYTEAAKAFKDPTLTAPFDAKEKTMAATDTVTAASDAMPEVSAEDIAVADEAAAAAVPDAAALADVLADRLGPLIREAVESALRDLGGRVDDDMDVDLDAEEPPSATPPALAASVLRMTRARCGGN